MHSVMITYGARDSMSVLRSNSYLLLISVYRRLDVACTADYLANDELNKQKSLIILATSDREKRSDPYFFLQVAGGV